MTKRALALAVVLALSHAGRVRGAEPPCTCAVTATGKDVIEGADSGQAALLDLNGADERALLSLPGIGPARAQAIIAYREQHGGFRSVSQLRQIKGIGPALLRRLRALVVVLPMDR